MLALPVETLIQIVGNLPDKDLFTSCTASNLWFLMVRHEAYKRWKKWANIIGNIYREIQAVREEETSGKINWMEGEYEVENLRNLMDVYTEEQLYIMEKMLKNGMTTDPQEKEIIEHALTEYRWGGDPWGFDWEWELKLFKLDL